jgi:hypothetical protein
MTKRTWDDHEQKFIDNPGRTIRRIVFWIIGLGLLISGGMWVVRILSVPGQVIEKTLDPNNIIQNYEWFKQQYQDYNAINQKCVDADSAVAKFSRDAGPRSSWTFEDKTEFSRLSSISDGLKYQRADIVAKYNARSQMMNREIFKGRDVPERLPQ